jgi:hypothetical protein
MCPFMGLRLFVALALVAVAQAVAAQPQPKPPDVIEKLVARLEQALQTSDRAALMALTARDTDAASLDEFAQTIGANPTRVVVKERDRLPLDNGRQDVLLEIFVERNIEGQLATWRMTVRPPVGRTDPEWRIEAVEPVSNLSGLFRLSLNTSKQFDVRNLVLHGTDLTLEMPAGTAFVAEIPEGPTAIVLIGRGRMKFSPPDEAEKTQLRIFSGESELVTEFDGAFLRVRPAEFESKFKAEVLVPRAAVAADARRASELFEEYISRSLQLDLTDLSRERWSLVPPAGDLIAEIRTRRFGSLTYARSGSEAEDVTLFDRRRRRNISIYASAEKLASRGRFYSEDDLVDYDVLAYEIDATFSPDRYWINGNAHLKVRVRSGAMTTMTLKLAEPLSVRGVYAPGFGRLLHLRVVNQNSLIVNLPSPLFRDAEFNLTVVYSGRLEPSELDREAVLLQSQTAQENNRERDPLPIPLEPRFIYSNNSYWYPQATVTDYALATLRLTAPAEFEVIASGTPAGPSTPASAAASTGTTKPMRTTVFQNDRPVRYLSCVISRLSPVSRAQLKIRTSTGSFGEARVLVPESAASNSDGSARPSTVGEPAPDLKGGDGDAERQLTLTVKANPRQMGRARNLSEQASSILQFYSSIVGEAPYPNFTLAVTENEVPGGHSPAYFAVLHQVLPTTQVVWRNDPVNFESFPQFYLAHELAHQWWGQAIGWKNYHEQWLSEGFSQYFAALYAEKQLESNVFPSVLRQMRRSGIDNSGQGPIYLGYRLGHIKGERPVFRSLVYNKSAMVLHMLRRLVGDDPFFWGVRRFYSQWRFKKAGTDDLRAAMEAATGRDLRGFFDTFIFGVRIPRLGFSYRSPTADSLVVKFEHRGDPVPVAITVTVTYSNGESDDFVVQVTEASTERTLTLKPGLGIRKVEANEDNGALVEIDRASS